MQSQRKPSEYQNDGQVYALSTLQPGNGNHLVVKRAMWMGRLHRQEKAHASRTVDFHDCGCNMVRKDNVLERFVPLHCFRVGFLLHISFQLNLQSLTQ